MEQSLRFYRDGLGLTVLTDKVLNADLEPLLAVRTESVRTVFLGDAERDTQAATQQCARVTEEWIRRYPDQWLWIHRRWKTRPAGAAPLYDDGPARA